MQHPNSTACWKDSASAWWLNVFFAGMYRSSSKSCLHSLQSKSSDVTAMGAQSQLSGAIYGSVKLANAGQVESVVGGAQAMRLM
jgi:hypothetical protein